MPSISLSDCRALISGRTEISVAQNAVSGILVQGAKIFRKRNKQDEMVAGGYPVVSLRLVLFRGGPHRGIAARSPPPIRAFE